MVVGPVFSNDLGASKIATSMHTVLTSGYTATISSQPDYNYFHSQNVLGIAVLLPSELM